MNNDNCPQSAYSDGNYKLSVDFNEDGTPYMYVSYIDADFPTGNLTEEQSAEIINMWFDETFPNMSQAQLNEIGIHANYIDGEVVYEDPSGTTVDESTIYGDLNTGERYIEGPLNNNSIL